MTDATRTELEERIFSRTEPGPNGCIVWTGYTNQRGYGRMAWHGTTYLTHRLAYELVNGPIPDGLVIDHLCHNPPCLNAEHLQAVTIRENQENRKGASANNATGVRGVTWDKARGKYVAYVGSGGRTRNVGRFASLADAEAAVIAARIRLHTHNILDRSA